MMAPISRSDEFINEKKDDEDIVKFKALLAEGKQAYVSGKFKEAEIKLSEAAELSVSIYGYFAIPTFDPHLYYGRTLLELARLEDSVFSNALQGMTTTEEKGEGFEEVESPTEKIGNALEENVEGLKNKIACCWVDSSNILKKNKEENGEKANIADKIITDVTIESERNSMKEQMKRDRVVKSDKGEDDDEIINHREERSKIEGKKKDDDVEVEEKEEKETEDEKDDKFEDNKDGISEHDSKDESSDAGDVEYLQLAWETLEVARTICDKHLEEEGWKEKKVEVLLDLADCATDAENYKQAIDDIDACILLAESIFGGVDRRVAQAYFVKGRTHNLSKDFGNAAKVFGNAKEILEARLVKLEAQLAHESQEEAEKIKEEINELKSLLPEIQIKIDDSLESARSLIKESIDAENGKEVSLKSSVKEMPVDDVSSLVRKKLKRPAEDEAQRKTKSAKGDGDPENAKIDSCP
ncbi:unnamed protein product [Cercopithifilaria johnstoni]|uniref:Tetratricopeptide SHNi-TPR domain-containing protein n=1 Tax=Cercopithifilaria johnstoni TaxID=2874296 RepID=A0A8J2MJH1_9BILA|nr:unnamed protein product [Cercopithifilaria johnstoni]